MRVPATCKAMALATVTTSAPCLAAAIKPYYHNASGEQYIYYPLPMNAPTGEQWCRDNGGHLTSYMSEREQQRVESYYVSAGFLLPTFHKVYWIGLNSSLGTYPNFTWVDNRTPGPSNSSKYYSHWGRFKPSKEYEPNNLITPPELCGCANVTEAFGSPPTWGWADWNCSAKFPVMCKMQPPLVARCDFEGRAYLLNTSYSNFKASEAACTMNGGHLVGYDTLAEQVAVESCFINQGFLLPKYHVHYWMGLISGVPGALWPNFTWIDRNDAIYKGNYQHWGIAGKDLEPNNLVPNEFCAGSNVTVMYTGAGGWADHNCKEQYVYICEIGSALAFPAYKPPGGNASFTFYTTPMDFDSAQSVCNSGGGHLASFADLQEQVCGGAALAGGPCQVVVDVLDQDKQSHNPQSTCSSWSMTDARMPHCVPWSAR
jgi:hypothetical protein